MNLLVVTDIFGRTKCLDELVEYLSDRQIQPDILDPYDGHYRAFENEEEAYERFRSDVGLDRYIHQLQEKVARIGSKNSLILGFSVGASALWAAAQFMKSDDRIRGLCFYSSQIRRYLDVVPKIDIELYFANNEPAYDVYEISGAVSRSGRVRCVMTGYGHGFMNEKSRNFNAEGFDTYRKIIKNRIAAHSAQVR